MGYLSKKGVVFILLSLFLVAGVSYIGVGIAESKFFLNTPKSGTKAKTKNKDKSNNKPAAELTAVITPVVNMDDLSGIVSSSAKSIKSHNVSNAWGTAILIPQSHRYPGSEIADSINDAAQKSQTSIYNILSALINGGGNQTFVMAEGDPYGPAPAGKIKNISIINNNQKTLSLKLRELEDELAKNNVDPSLSGQVVNNAKLVENKYQRAIILQGAPYKLKAEGSAFELYGSENQRTVEEGKLLVRDYIYLTDRLNQLNENPSALAAKPENLEQTFDIKSLIELLKKPRLPEQALMNGLNSLKKIFADNNEMSSKTEGLINAVGDLSSSFNAFNMPKSGEQAPSREDNPYANINSVREIESKLAENEKQINRVVIKQRNQETAENFAKGLREKHLNAGILQYGAGHEEGLVQELVSQGLSVLVITPAV